MGTAVAIDPLLFDADARMKRLLATADPGRSLHNVPMSRFVRSVNEVFRMAGVHETDGHMEDALALYLRFASLVMESMPTHPEYRELNNAERVKINTKVRAAVERAEMVKRRVKAQFAEEAQYHANERQRLEEAARKRREFDSTGDAMSHVPIASPSASAAIPMGSHRQPILLPSEASDRRQQPVQAPRAPSPTPGAPSLVHTTHDYDASEESLQQVLLPADLVEQFAMLAGGNTQLNKETCGVLCGKLVSGQLVMTTCVLPKQTGGSDSCVTDDEYEVFDLQDKHDLITLGWIHTHPSQTAFLSSVDMHTHFAYQALLPEAIAVVYSPKFNETGVFRLSHVGLRQIEQCREKGFHPHQQVPPLFKSSSHARFDDNLRVNMVDLR